MRREGLGRGGVRRGGDEGRLEVVLVGLRCHWIRVERVDRMWRRRRSLTQEGVEGRIGGGEGVGVREVGRQEGRVGGRQHLRERMRRRRVMMRRVRRMMREVLGRVLLQVVSSSGCVLMVVRRRRRGAKVRPGVRVQPVSPRLGEGVRPGGLGGEGGAIPRVNVRRSVGRSDVRARPRVRKQVCFEVERLSLLHQEVRLRGGLRRAGG